jgi:hypothetical protein
MVAADLEVTATEFKRIWKYARGPVTRLRTV